MWLWVCMFLILSSPPTSPGTIITITARSGHSTAQAIVVVGNPLFTGRTFYVCGDKWTPLMAGITRRKVFRAFGMVAVEDVVVANDGEVAKDGVPSLW